jgi:hypothetical protein
VWDNGAIANFIVHFDGKIDSASATKARWKGTIWFTDRFDFDPIWNWGPEKMRNRSADAERRVRIAYVLSLGKDFDVESVKAEATQCLTLNPGAKNTTDEREKLHVVGPAPTAGK